MRLPGVRLVKIPIFALFLLLVFPQVSAQVTELRRQGYSLIPSPQRVELAGSQTVIDSSWDIVHDASIPQVSVRRLKKAGAELHGLFFEGSGTGRIELYLSPGSVQETEDAALNEQGYELEISDGKVVIRGSGEAGLFYGVQSLLQLMRGTSSGRVIVPDGRIVDWPDFQLRFIHWDTKHHQKRVSTLYRLIDWAAFFKVNAIGFEMEDKYEYPRHPIIGAPGAYTKEEMHRITAYALERHIQLVPVIQSPAHMAYVLKHKEFEHLRADPESNYQICLCNEEAIRLILDMYQDMIDATPGVDYFHVSTDEVYFAGICGECDQPFNDANRSQAWVDFVKQVHPWLEERGRRMIAWVEWPLEAEDILQLPPDLIDGVMGGDREFLEQERKVGIRQLAYSSIQGMEDHFPNYFPTTYRGRPTEGRLQSVSRTIKQGLKAGAVPIGSFAAAWDDAGLHEETFWLGWATVTQYAWSHQAPTVDQSVADFMDQYYGRTGPDMVEIYRLLLDGARFFESSWDQVISRERERAYDDRERKFDTRHRRFDKALTMPSLPDEKDLSLEPVFSLKYGELLGKAREQRFENDRLRALLLAAFSRVERNRYSIEVFLSIAQLQQYFINTLMALESAEKSLLEASRHSANNDHRAAVGELRRAASQLSSLLNWGDWMWRGLKSVWERSRFRKGRSVDGRDYLHVMDDLKDHPADRRPGLEYLIMPFERLEMGAWRDRLLTLADDYARRHGVDSAGEQE